MSKRLKVGDDVKCVFRDHVQNGRACPVFLVQGRLLDIEKDAYKIGSWVYYDENDALLDDNRGENETWYHISKGSVISIKKVE